MEWYKEFKIMQGCFIHASARIEQLQAENMLYEKAFNEIGQTLVSYPHIAEKRIAAICKILFEALKGGVE